MAVFTAVALLMAACTQAPAITLALDNTTPEVILGADTAVEVTLTRTANATADVALTVTGLPANVTASFSPATLSGATLTSTMTIAADAAAAEGSYDLSVVGTGAGLNTTAALALEVSSLTVNGRVVGPFNIPVSGLAVRSQGDTDLTNADGSFTLTGLTVPYDLSVWSTTDDWVQIYQGLSTGELRLSPFPAQSSLPSSSFSTTVGGNLTGGQVPVGANQVVMICVEGVDVVALGCSTLDDPADGSTYSLGVSWIGSSTGDVRLHVLQVERDAGGYAVSYPGYASRDLQLTDSVPVLTDLDLGSSLATTTVEVALDSSATISGLIAAVGLGPNFAMPVAVVPSSAAAHEVLMPVIPDSTFSFVGVGGGLGQFGWQGEVTGDSSHVTVPGAPLLATPADLATGVTSATSISATNPTSGPMTFILDDTVAGLTVAVSTMAEAITLPDLTQYGLAWTPGADIDWQILGHSGASTEGANNALQDYFNSMMLISSSSSGFQGEGTFAVSDSRTFTLAP